MALTEEEVGGLDDWDDELFELKSVDGVGFDVNMNAMTELSKFMATMCEWDSPFYSLTLRTIKTAQLKQICEYINHFKGKLESQPPTDIDIVKVKTKLQTYNYDKHDDIFTDGILTGIIDNKWELQFAKDIVNKDNENNGFHVRMMSDANWLDMKSLLYLLITIFAFKNKLNLDVMKNVIDHHERGHDLSSLLIEFYDDKQIDALYVEILSEMHNLSQTIRNKEDNGKISKFVEYVKFITYGAQWKDYKTRIEKNCTYWMYSKLEMIIFECRNFRNLLNEDGKDDIDKLVECVSKIKMRKDVETKILKAFIKQVEDELNIVYPSVILTLIQQML